MTVHLQPSWTCESCDETGDTDRGAEKHTKATGHGTDIHNRPVTR